MNHHTSSENAGRWKEKTRTRGIQACDNGTPSALIRAAWESMVRNREQTGGGRTRGDIYVPISCPSSQVSQYTKVMSRPTLLPLEKARERPPHQFKKGTAVNQKRTALNTNLIRADRKSEGKTPGFPERAHGGEKRGNANGSSGRVAGRVTYWCAHSARKGTKKQM